MPDVQELKVTISANDLLSNEAILEAMKPVFEAGFSAGESHGMFGDDSANDAWERFKVEFLTEGER